MSDHQSVPLTRELLEALRRDAEVRFRLADKGSDEEAAAFALVGKCMVLLDRPAALASDAGTPDCDGWRQSVFDQFRQLHGHHDGCCIRQFTDWMANGGGPTKPEPPTTNAPEISTSLVDAAAPDRKEK